LYDRFDLLDALGRGDGTAAEFQDLHIGEYVYFY
jgi:hypothetical protein